MVWHLMYLFLPMILQHGRIFPKHRDLIVPRGPPKIHPVFHMTPTEDAFPQTFLAKRSKMERRHIWIGYSTSKLFCFSCCLFHDTNGKEGASLLALADGGI